MRKFVEGDIVSLIDYSLNVKKKQSLSQEINCVYKRINRMGTGYTMIM